MKFSMKTLKFQFIFQKISYKIPISQIVLNLFHLFYHNRNQCLQDSYSHPDSQRQKLKYARKIIFVIQK